MSTIVMTCTCKHEFQDKKYGKNRRVFNNKADRIANMWNCTICGKDRSGSKTVKGKK